MTARRLSVLTALSWPIGLLLVAVNIELEPPVGAFAVLTAAYAAGVFAVLRAWADRDRTAFTLVAAAPALFALVGFAGPPTADDPGLMLLNTGALALLAGVLLLMAIRIVVDHRSSPHLPIALAGVVVFVAASTLYFGNLLARVAVVLSGASEQQAAVEDEAWVAYEYLRELDGTPDHLSYLLVWLDLIQLTYVAVAYLAFAGLARMLGRQGSVTQRAAHGIGRTAYAMATVPVVAAVAAMALPREADLVPAWVAFVTSIPFMTTIVPFALGLAVLTRRREAAMAAEGVGRPGLSASVAAGGSG